MSIFSGYYTSLAKAGEILYYTSRRSLNEAAQRWTTGREPRNVNFCPNAELRLVDPAFPDALETYVVPSVMSDRCLEGQHALSNRALGLSVRHPTEASVNRQLINSISGFNQTMQGSSPTMEFLAVRKRPIALEEFYRACLRLISEVSANERFERIFEVARREGCQLCCLELYHLLLDIESYRTVSDDRDAPMDIQNIRLREDLKRRVRSWSSRVEVVDIDTFQALTHREDSSSGTPLGSIPPDVVNAPEYKSLLRELREGTWKAGEERRLTLTSFREASELEAFLREGGIIDALFEDRHFQQCLTMLSV